MSPSVQRAETLALDRDDHVARQITAGAHGGLLVLERGLNDRGVLRTVITVDEKRGTISFFGSAAARCGWRGWHVDPRSEVKSKVGETAPQDSSIQPPRAACCFV